MPISEGDSGMEGFFGDLPDPAAPDSVGNEPLTRRDIRDIWKTADLEDYNDFDTEKWHHCISAVIAGRIYQEIVENIENEYRGQTDFVYPNSYIKARARLFQATQLMQRDFMRNPSKVKEAWSWFCIGAELPALDPYLDQLDDAIIAQGQDLGQRIQEARKRLL